jgi:hypothetical protein
VYSGAHTRYDVPMTSGTKRATRERLIPSLSRAETRQRKAALNRRDRKVARHDARGEACSR